MFTSLPDFVIVFVILFTTSLFLCNVLLKFDHFCFDFHILFGFVLNFGLCNYQVESLMNYYRQNDLFDFLDLLFIL